MDRPRLSLVVIRSRNIERSAQFYATLGLQPDGHHVELTE